MIIHFPGYEKVTESLTVIGITLSIREILHTALDFVEQYDIEMKDSDKLDVKKTTINEDSEEEKSDLEKLDKKSIQESDLSKVRILFPVLQYFCFFFLSSYMTVFVDFFNFENSFY